MKKLFILFLSALSFYANAESNLADDQIRQLIIQDSIASYSGNCPCPYNIARNRSKCGGRSAYSRHSGASPVCYASDVSKEMIDSYRRKNRL